MPNEETVVKAIQDILGNSPKSSLLFGAPAISLRQIHASLETTSPTLTSQDILVAAAQAAPKVFKGSKHAQLKKLMRAGAEEEWIVFRPSLALAVPADQDDQGLSRVGLEGSKGTAPVLAKTPDRMTGSERLTGSGQDGEIRDSGDENVLTINLLPIPQDPRNKTNVKNKLFRPFLKKETSKGIKPNGDLRLEETSGDSHMVLPPAHRIDPADLGLSGLPVTGAKPTATNPKIDRGPVSIESNSTEATKWRRPPRRDRPAQHISPASHDTMEKHTRTDSPPESDLHALPISQVGTVQQTYIPVDIVKPSIVPAQSRGDPAPSSLPYLAGPPKLSGVTDEPSTSVWGGGSQMVESIGLNEAQQAGTSPVTPLLQARRILPLDHAAPPPTSTLDLTISPTSATSSINSLTLSPLLSASSVPTSSLLTPSYFSDPPSPSSPLSPAQPTPWLGIAFQDLPFGPDVPAFHVISWAKNRWRILGAEMVIVLGAVYVIQVIGI